MNSAECEKSQSKINVFYREAGAKDKPAILLLHGFPSASHMFSDLPNAEIHYVPSGHFALESHHTEIAQLMREFLAKVIL